MAKKKSKKHIKLNNKIREIFGGIPFEDGITSLPDELLVELSMAAEIKPSSLDRESLIRGLRRVWSEGRYKVRSAIVDYLSERYKKTDSSDTNRYADKDKVGKILSILSSMGHTKDEEEEILKRFIDAKHSKITPQKIANTLRYLRLSSKLSALEDALGISIDSSGDMEFYHSFSFSLPDVDFSKNLLVSTRLDGWEGFMGKNDDELIEYLKAQKKSLVEKKQSKINTFVDHLFARPHIYLSPKQIEEHLRKMPPEIDLEHIPLDITIVKSIIEKIDSEFVLIDTGRQYIVEKYTQTALHSSVLPYRIRAVYDKEYLNAKIWRGDKSLGIAEDIESLDEDMMRNFESFVQEIYNQAKEMTEGLDVDDEIIWRYILQFIDPQIIDGSNVRLHAKITRRVMYHLGEYIRPLREKKLREELLAKTIRDFKLLFPLARSLKRKITFFAGPTNSGKTYTAMQRLYRADSGYYLAPLRLLALEGYESLKSQGIPSSLITGEEEIIDEESTHISSTIEMLNFDVDVECCVIDEIQMIADRDRGWAWANALIGAPAKEIILTGSADAVEAVRELAEYLGEELEVVFFERKNPLSLLSRSTSLKNIKPHTAVVAFSRKEVLSIKQRLLPYHNVSVVYGNLSPEVRREEARKFREGESDVLVATDAIAMGLNLPIKTLLFTRDNKFDGLRRRELGTSEILQIAGRAGRYGLHEHGWIGALDETTLRSIAEKFDEPLPDLKLPFSVMASLHHVELIGEILETEKLLEILTFFADNMEFEGPFRAANIESMLEIAEIVDEYDLDLRSRYHLATAPVSISSPYIESAFHRYIKHLEKGESVPYRPPRDLPSYAHTNEELLGAEDRVKEVSLYLWLSFRFADKFPDTQAAIESRSRLNKFIEKSLSKGELIKRCARCGKALDFTYRFSICDRCYRKGKQGVYRKREKKR